MKKYILTLIATILVFTQGASLNAQSVPDPKDVNYLFHLYYDNGSIVADRDYPQNYDLVGPGVIPSFGDYQARITSYSNKLLETVKFDPTNGQANFKGKFDLRLRYFPNAAEVGLYNPAGARILTVSVALSSVCNEDKTCDDYESRNNCPSDCLTDPITPTRVSSPTPSVIPVADGSGISGLLKPLLYIIIGLGILGWFLWRKHRRNVSNSVSNPQ